MKHQILVLSLFSAVLQFLPLLPHKAEAQNTYWGLSTMAFTRNSPTKLNGEASRKSVALCLNKAKMAALKGTKIIGVRMAYATNKVTDFKIFLTKALDGMCLQEKTPVVNTRPYNLADYLFDTPVEIDGSELFVGYEVTAQDVARPVCFFDKSKDYPEGTVWALLNGKWTDISSMGLGAPVLQLILDDMPETYTDAVMKSCESESYFKIGKNYSSENTVFNLGNKPITSLKVSTRLDGCEAQVENIMGLDIQPGAEGVFVSHNLTPNSSGLKSWAVSILAVNGEEDTDVSDNTQTSEIYVYPDGVSRNMIIEKYTGQDCKWCSSGDVQITKFMKGRDDMIEVAHHTYPTKMGDAFTMMESEVYSSMFGITVYPSAALNRRPVSSSSVIVDDISVSVAGITAVADSIVKQPIPVTVDLDNQFDESTRKGKLTVKVHTYENPSSKTHTLNLWLSQDNMIAYQAGETSNYNHSHVFRGTLNGETWGEPITLTVGEDLVKTYDYEIPAVIASTAGTREEWKAVPADMHIVAFVADKTDSRFTNVIYNANTIGVTTNGSTTGMTNVSVSKPQVVVAEGAVSVFGDYRQAVVYTMDGKHVVSLNGTGRVALSKGVYVVRVDDRSTKVVVK